YNANGGSGSIADHTCEMNGSCTIKGNTFTRNGYSFTGWTTRSDGVDDNYKWTNWSGTWKYKDGEYGIANKTLVLYAMWKKNSVVLPDTFVIPAGYTNDVGKSYISDTLKYKTIKKDNYNRYYSLIWVKDANAQLNSANNNLNGGNRYSMIANEVKNMNYRSKGLIATNGSFTWNSRANIPVIITKGSLVVNDKYVTTLNDGRSLVYATLTLGKNNLLTYKTTSNATEANNWLTSIGARNTWAITHFETSNWSGGTDGGADHRSSICQIDENNFVLYSGHSSGIHDYMKELHDLFGCKTVVNLDGGGSTGMYYKTKSMTDVGTVYQYNNPAECCGAKCNYRCRSVADILYFVE
ncbi:MAG: phosphodiester glycosidase family protein, partial [Bacilli bacterium]|nr:phosphodiester glycosidase family protein [Bacilli bacterium]